MPETPVHKHGKPFARKGEIWVSWKKRIMKLPTPNTASDQRRSKPPFGGPISTPANGGHYLTSPLAADRIHAFYGQS